MHSVNALKENYRKGDRNFASWELPEASLSYQTLRQANFRAANLFRANLFSTSLEEADFTQANLAFANLSQANLSQANLVGANLEGANLRDAILTQAIFDETTRFPQGFKPNKPSQFEAIAAASLDESLSNNPTVQQETVQQETVQQETIQQETVQQKHDAAHLRAHLSPAAHLALSSDSDSTRIQNEWPASPTPPEISSTPPSPAAPPPLPPPPIPPTHSPQPVPTQQSDWLPTQSPAVSAQQSDWLLSSPSPITTAPKKQNMLPTAIAAITTLLVVSLGFAVLQSPDAQNRIQNRQTNPFEAAIFPQSACGDPMPTDYGAFPVRLYPVFIDYNSRNLNAVIQQYCRDAYRNTRASGDLGIQVASFTNLEKAQQFAAFMQNRIGSGDVGQPNTYTYRDIYGVNGE